MGFGMTKLRSFGAIYKLFNLLPAVQCNYTTSEEKINQLPACMPDCCRIYFKTTHVKTEMKYLTTAASAAPATTTTTTNLVHGRRKGISEGVVPPPSRT